MYRLAWPSDFFYMPPVLTVLPPVFLAMRITLPCPLLVCPLPPSGLYEISRRLIFVYSVLFFVSFIPPVIVVWLIFLICSFCIVAEMMLLTTPPLVVWAFTRRDWRELKEAWFEWLLLVFRPDLTN